MINLSYSPRKKMDILMVVKILLKSVCVRQNFNIKVTQIKKEFGPKFIEKI